MVRDKNRVVLFLIGMFTSTEVRMWGYIAISEIFIALIGPFLYFKNHHILKREGFAPVLNLLILTMIGCIIASIANHSEICNFARGFAAPYILFCSIVCLHKLLRDNFDETKWVLFGACVSLIISIFIFQKGSSRVRGSEELSGVAAIENVVGYALFWTSMISNWARLPIQGWYQKTPIIYTYVVVLGLPIFALFNSGGSGRSAALCAMVSALLIIFGGKTLKKLASIKRNLPVMLIILLCFVVVFKAAYKHLATTGQLGEAAVAKYEGQTKRGTGFLALLMGGRSAFFAGAYVAYKNPIVGYGSWTYDYDGIFDDFWAKYGVGEEYENYLKDKENDLRNGRSFGLIGAHSWIIDFWLKYGIFGLIFWCYILWLIGKIFFKCLHLYPPWFGWLAIAFPSMVWNLLFSPFGGRVLNGMIIVAMLLLKASSEGKIPVGGFKNPYIER